LREGGLGSLDALARLSQGEQEGLATRLGRGKAVVAYWCAQARLLAQGIETDFLPSLADANSPPLDDSEARLLLAALPQVVAPQAHDSFYPGERPLGLLSPPGGVPDDFGRIEGIDAKTAQSLNELGIWTFRQIASWSPGQGRWIESFLAAPGRVGREHWREQAARLAGLTQGKHES
jgi:predicted flap endonuclease-1-like 5' DNA nuclease